MKLTTPSKNRLLVDLEQFTWAQKALTRLAAKAASEPSRALRLAVIGFAEKLNKAPEQQGDLLILPTNRNELRILEKVVNEEHGALLTAIIPGYQAKLESAEAASRVSLQAYLDTSVKRANMLAQLKNLINQRLAS